MRFDELTKLAGRHEKVAVTKQRMIRALFSPTLERKAGKGFEAGIRRGEEFGAKVEKRLGKSPTADRAAELLMAPTAKDRKLIQKMLQQQAQ